MGREKSTKARPLPFPKQHYRVNTHFLNEFLDALDDVLVELDRLDGPAGERVHLGLRDRRLDIVEARELRKPHIQFFIANMYEEEKKRGREKPTTHTRTRVHRSTLGQAPSLPRR